MDARLLPARFRFALPPIHLYNRATGMKERKLVEQLASGILKQKLPAI